MKSNGREDIQWQRGQNHCPETLLNKEVKETNSRADSEAENTAIKEGIWWLLACSSQTRLTFMEQH